MLQIITALRNDLGRLSSPTLRFLKIVSVAVAIIPLIPFGMLYIEQLNTSLLIHLFTDEGTTLEQLQVGLRTLINYSMLRALGGFAIVTLGSVAVIFLWVVMPSQSCGDQPNA